MEFRDRRVLITGAAGIYGRWFAEAFAAEGARLCLSDNRAEALAETVRSRVVVDGRNCLDVARWSAAGWQVYALGRAAQQVRAT